MSHVGKIPSHLVPKHLVVEKKVIIEAQKNNAKEDSCKPEKYKGLVTSQGYFLTYPMKEYVEEIVFGGVYRSLAQWSAFVGVAIAVIRRWNKHPGVMEYLQNLRGIRKQYLQEGYEATLGTVLNELCELMKIQCITKNKSKKGIKIKIDGKALEVKRQAIKDFLDIVYREGHSNGSPLQVNINNQQVATGVSNTLIPSEDSIDDELDELRAVNDLNV